MILDNVIPGLIRTHWCKQSSALYWAKALLEDNSIICKFTVRFICNEAVIDHSESPFLQSMPHDKLTVKESAVEQTLTCLTHNKKNNEKNPLPFSLKTEHIYNTLTSASQETGTEPNKVRRQSTADICLAYRKNQRWEMSRGFFFHSYSFIYVNWWQECIFFFHCGT